MSEIDRVTLRELETRYAQEQAAARADAHRRVDELFDRQAAQQRAEFERLASLLRGEVPH